ncbi:hypothetical protein [Bacillus dakarensis]|uniref:hypothetical protein n=1 Tax=Robertmurraya dakarensis TaxID=1926278 RepID=UPI00098204E2|nr:hypothetical protein [Bacillus dakarensis]
MHPTELIEWLLAGSVLMILLVISFFFRGKGGKAVRWAAVVYLLSYIIFYLVRPYWIDMQIEEKVGFLQMYLEQRYPGETWEIWTVPHREDGYESMNPYTIGVIFKNEPEVQYYYFVRDKDIIFQTSYSIENDLHIDLLHID